MKGNKNTLCAYWLQAYPEESKFCSFLSHSPSEFRFLKKKRDCELTLPSQRLPWAYEEKAKNYLGFSFLALSSILFTLVPRNLDSCFLPQPSIYTCPPHPWVSMTPTDAPGRCHPADKRPAAKCPSILTQTQKEKKKHSKTEAGC